MNLLFIFWMCVTLTVLALGLSFAAYFFVFRTPSDVCNRVKREDYLHNALYHQYSVQIKKNFAEFDELEYKRIYLKSRDGLKLAGRYIEVREGAPVCVMMNGYKGEVVGDFNAVIPICRKMGCNILLPDQRACGLSEGKCQTFGIKESLDTLDWIKYVRKRFGDDTPILLIGVSMGAATVLMTADSVPDNVKGIFADCSYTNIKDAILAVASVRKLPGSLLYPFVRIGAKLFGGFDIEEESPEHVVTKSKVPVCLIHGYSDDIVPYVMCGKLYDACSSEKYMYTVDRAGHAASIYENPSKYEAALTAFVSKAFEE